MNRGKSERGDGKTKAKLQKKEKKEISSRAVADLSVTSDGEFKKDVVELDARTLARDCLKELGREMGVSN